MIKRLLLFGLMAMLVVALLLGGCGGGDTTTSPTQQTTAPAQTTTQESVTYEWSIQSAYPHGDASMDALYDFADKVYELSGGKMKVNVFADTEIVTADQLLEATKMGTLEMAQACGTYWGGVIPLGEVEMGLPMLYSMPDAKDLVEANTMVTDFFNSSGFMDLLREEYAKQGVYYLDIHTYSGDTINLNKKVVTLDDFKGLKIRSQGAFAVWINELGGLGVEGGGGEAYMEIKLGTIDGLHWDISAITGMHTNEVAPYLMRGINNDLLVGHIIVNMDAWNSLPTEMHEVLRDAAAYYRQLTGQIYKGEWDKTYALADRGEVELVPVDDAFVAKSLEVSMGLWDEYSARDEACAKAIALVKEWRGLE